VGRGMRKGTSKRRTRKKRRAIPEPIPKHEGPDLSEPIPGDGDTGGIDTHNFILLKGEYTGERLTRVPLSYLRWMAASGHEHADYAEAEMQRRGTRKATIHLTAHAIDRASLKCLSVWIATRQENEGIYSWLMRIAEEALKNGKQDSRDKEVYLYKGVRFIFVFDGKLPVLKTLAD